MTLHELKAHVKTPVFFLNDVVKLYPEEPKNHINTQLYRMTTRGDLVGLKRGIYIFPETKVDEFVIANKLYTPSYVSLESVLNSSGIIPDIVSNVTSVTPTTSKRLTTPLGNYSYSKIDKSLFFGYTSILDEQSGVYYDVAVPEKALLDFIYIRKIKDLVTSRVDMSVIDREVLFNYSIHFPKWVIKVIKNA